MKYPHNLLNLVLILLFPVFQGLAQGRFVRGEAKTEYCISGREKGENGK
jgi:hypothetical protein